MENGPYPLHLWLLIFYQSSDPKHFVLNNIISSCTNYFYFRDHQIIGGGGRNLNNSLVNSILPKLSSQYKCLRLRLALASMVAQMVKNLKWGDPVSIPGLGRSPGEGNGNPLQHSCLENAMDRGVWRATVMESQRVRHH